MEDEHNTLEFKNVLEYSKSIVATHREPCLALNKNLQVISANPTFYSKFKISEKETLGNPINEIGNKQWDIPKLLNLLKEILPEEEVIKDYEITHKFEQIGKRTLLLNAYQLRIPVENVPKKNELILLSIEDITEQQQKQDVLKKSEERYRRAFETSKDGLLLVHKTKGKILESNKAAQDKLGYSEKEFSRKKLWEVGVTENHSDFREMMTELEKDGIFNYKDTTVKTKDGSKINADVFLVDRAKVAQCNIRDNSEIKNTQKKLKKRTVMLEEMLDGVQDVIGFQKPNHTIIRYNQTGYDLLDLSPEEVKGKKCYELLGRDEECQDCATQKALKSKNVETVEKLYPGLDKYLRVTSKPVLDKDGEVSFVIEQLRDITEQKEKKKKLEQYKSAVESAGESIFMINKNCRYVFANKKHVSRLSKAGHITEKAKRQVIDRKIDDIFPEEVVKKFLRNVKKVFETGKSHNEISKSSKGEIWSSRTFSPVKNSETGGIEAVSVVSEDITDQKKKEKVLKKTKKKLNRNIERYQQLFENINNCVAVYKVVENGENFILVDFNKAAEKTEQIKREEIIGKKITEVFPRIEEFGLLGLLKKVYKNGEPEYHPATRYEDGRISGWRENYIYKLSTEEIVVVYEDITEKKKAEEEREELQNQLLQSQKMDAIGELTGGVAHDFNNIITSIKLTAQLLLEEDLPDEVKNDLSEINKSSVRAKNLTKQLLQFSRKDTAPKEIINLNTVVENTFEMLKRIIPENIDINFSLEDELRQVEAAPSTMEQVIMNLVINARDAISEGGGISVETKNAEITSNNLTTPEIKPGKYVKLTVQDNGKGMDKEKKNKIFEPFFTTKRVDEGTGMGLSVVYGVVKNSEGAITVETAPGEGTSINIFLPAVKEEESKQIEEKKDKERESKDITGKGLRVLVIEDEEEVKKVTSKVFNKMDFEIFTAGTVKEAEAVFKENKEDIDIVFADVILPDGNGIEVAKRFKKLKDDLRIIATSGYIADEIDQEDIAKEDFKFIEKPFSLKKIREILTELSGEIKNT